MEDSLSSWRPDALLVLAEGVRTEPTDLDRDRLDLEGALTGLTSTLSGTGKLGSDWDSGASARGVASEETSTGILLCSMAEC